MIDYGYGVYLDTLKREKLEVYRHARNDSAVMTWCRQYKLIDSDSQVEWYDRQRKDPTVVMFEVIAHGEPVGVAGLTGIDLINRRAEFSLYLFPKKQGKGLSKPALKTLFLYGFDVLGLNLIWGETFEHNHASDIFLDLGMNFEGRRKDFYFRDGRFIDAHLFSVRRDDWMI